MVAGLVVGPGWLVDLGVLIYVVLAVLTFFDGDEAERVGKRVYGGGGGQAGLGPGRSDLRSMSPAIAAQLEAARREQDQIAQNITGSDLPLGEVGPEVDDLGRAMESLGQRAQRIHAYLETQDHPGVSRRLADLESAQSATPDPGRAQAIDALRHQGAALVKLEDQLAAFYAKMEGIVAALGTINAEVVRMSVASEDAGETEIADRVRSLREQVDSAAEGLQAAYAESDAPAPGS